MIVSIEQHVDWIADCLGHLREHAAATASRPTPQAEARLGASTSTRWPTARSIRWPTPGTWAPTSPASRACSCPMSAASTATSGTATTSRPRATRASCSPATRRRGSTPPNTNSSSGGRTPMSRPPCKPCAPSRPWSAKGSLTPDPRLAEAAEAMAIAITPEMLALIDRADPRTIRSRASSCPAPPRPRSSADELADPIGDEARSPVKGIVHRYPDRVLLKPLHVCPVYCRFCFRREKVGPGRRGAVGRRARRRARLHPGASGDLGSDPDRRRSADAVAAAAGRADRGSRRHRPCRRDPHPQPRADRRSRRA